MLHYYDKSYIYLHAIKWLSRQCCLRNTCKLFGFLININLYQDAGDNAPLRHTVSAQLVYFVFFFLAAAAPPPLAAG